MTIKTSFEVVDYDVFNEEVKASLTQEDDKLPVLSIKGGSDVSLNVKELRQFAVVANSMADSLEKD